MADAIIISTQIALNADTLPDGDLKRVPTKEEIALWNAGGGGDDLPEGTTLETIPDGTTRLAISLVDRQKLDAYVENDGKTGDAHATRQDNPHVVTAAQVGAPTVAAFDAAAAAIDALDTRMDSVENTNSSQSTAISALETAVDNLSGGNPGFRWIPLRAITNSNILTDMPAATTEWTSAVRTRYNFASAQKMRASCRVSAVGHSSAVARPVYSTNGFSSFTEITGMDISLASTTPNGIYSAEIDIPSGLKTAGDVLISVAGNGGNDTADPSLVGYTIEVFDSAVVTGAFELPIGLEDTEDDASGSGRLAMTNAERSKLSGIEAGAEVNDVTSVHGRNGAVVAASGDYTTDQITESTDKKFVTDAEKAKLANVPSDTNAALDSKADGAATTAALSNKADSDTTTAALATKAPIASPTFTGTPTAPSPATNDNSTKLATTAYVQAQPVKSHIHGSTADVSGLDPRLAAIEADIAALTGGSTATKALLTVVNATAVDIPDQDVVFIEHSGVNANVRIPASWTKKPHTLVFLGNPNTINIAGAIGAGQTIKGGSLTFSSGTDAAAVTRTVMPDPDTENFPNRWRIF
jgi:hypothetical protein